MKYEFELPVKTLRFIIFCCYLCDEIKPDAQQDKHKCTLQFIFSCCFEIELVQAL